MDRQTKKVAGVDLHSGCFLYAPDTNDVSTWKCPVLILGDEQKTMNIVRTHLQRFDAMTADMPYELRQELWEMLRGCCVTRGIPCERRSFAAPIDVPTRAVEPRPALAATQLPPSAEMAAMADAKATAFLKSLGLE